MRNANRPLSFQEPVHLIDSAVQSIANYTQVMPEVSVQERYSQDESAALRDDPRWHLIQRILSSPGFSKSVRTSHFLRYIAIETLENRGSLLNEQKVGIEVFERKPNYDSGDDNIVRSHASRLRQRLETYFLNEGKDESVQVSLPRGAYILSFKEMSRPTATEYPVEEEQRETEDLPTSGSSPVGRGGRLHKVALMAASILVVVLFLYSMHLRRQLIATSVSSSLGFHALWSEVFNDKTRTLVVPADSPLVLYEELEGKLVDLSSYMNKAYMVGEALQPGRTKDEIANMIAHRRLTSIADLELATRLLRVPEASTGKAEVRYARDLQIADLKGANVILIGAASSNPWVSVFDSQLNFVITHDTSDFSKTLILNRSPLDSEQKTYQIDLADPKHRAFAVVALVKNLGDSGYGLLVQGTSIAGTQAASEFITDPHLIGPLLDSYLAKYGRVPPFELLLDTTDLDGTAPQSHVLASRVRP